MGWDGIHMGILGGDSEMSRGRPQERAGMVAEVDGGRVA